MGDSKAPFLSLQASETLKVMADAAVLAGGELLAAAKDVARLSITEKTAGDFVSEADQAAEETISTYLLRHFPAYGWLGEETGENPSAENGLRWIVDPLDGTTNFLKGLPHWAVSIALCRQDLPLAAIIYDPVKGEMFSAEMGQGAQLNGQAIRVSHQSVLGSALLATGVPAGERVTFLPHCLRDLERLMPLTSGVRRWGAAALDLAYIGAGRLDCYWERNLGPWDIAAGILIVKEAGGVVAPLWPDADVLSSGSFVAGHADIVELIAPMLDTSR